MVPLFGMMVLFWNVFGNGLPNEFCPSGPTGPRGGPGGAPCGGGPRGGPRYPFAPAAVPGGPPGPGRYGPPGLIMPGPGLPARIGPGDAILGGIPGLLPRPPIGGIPRPSMELVGDVIGGIRPDENLGNLRSSS